MSTVGCDCVDMDAVDECLSLSVDTMDTHPWMGQGRLRGTDPSCITCTWAASSAEDTSVTTQPSRPGGRGMGGGQAAAQASPPRHRVPPLAALTSCCPARWQVGPHPRPSAKVSQAPSTRWPCKCHLPPRKPRGGQQPRSTHVPMVPPGTQPGTMHSAYRPIPQPKGWRASSSHLRNPWPSQR